MQTRALPIRNRPLSKLALHSLCLLFIYLCIRTCTHTHLFSPWNLYDKPGGFPNAAPIHCSTQGIGTLPVPLVLLCIWGPGVLRAPFRLHQNLLSTHINRSLLTLQFQLCTFCILTRKSHLSIFRQKKPQVTEATWMRVFRSAQKHSQNWPRSPKV